MIISLLNGLLPSFLSVPVYRLRGFAIGKKSKISFGAFLFCKKLVIGEGVKIGPMVVIRSKDFKAGDHTSIRPLSFISTAKVYLGRYVQISGPTVISSDNTPTAALSVGDHSRIFPYCWLETGAGIELGKQVGIGGQTQIFTHGYWTNYLKRGPISFGPVIIEDDVWIAWRVFIMPNVVIGKAAIVAANSVVNRSVPAWSIAAGNPAKAVKQLDETALSYEELITRTTEILDSFLPFAINNGFASKRINDEMVEVGDIKIANAPSQLLQEKDFCLYVDEVHDEADFKSRVAGKMNCIQLEKLEAYVFHPSREATLFIGFLRKYGIRLYIN